MRLTGGEIARNGNNGKQECRRCSTYLFLRTGKRVIIVMMINIIAHFPVLRTRHVEQHPDYVLTNANYIGNPNVEYSHM